jgi:hypothetical protein
LLVMVKFDIRQLRRRDTPMTKRITEKVLVQRLRLTINEGQREATHKLALLR